MPVHDYSPGDQSMETTRRQGQGRWLRVVRRGPGQRRNWLALLGLVCLACLPPKDERLTCDDLLEASEVRYGDLEALVTSAVDEKGCGVADCHGADTANQGLRFDTPSTAYDALTTRLDAIYGQVSSGEMPEDGDRWDEADLRLLRSWYCNGSFPSP